MLQIKHVSKQYRTGELVQKALDDVSLNLRDSEFVAILGPSGSGKTTLLNIIGGLDRYDDGDLVINGVSTKEYHDREWDTYRNHSIGFVFQSYNLIQHQTVLANVELALTIAGLSAKERKERAVRALEQVGLGDQIHKKPNQMSGGQMQRVALARALVNDPDILLADEPTGALDTETSIQVMNLLKDVAKDRLVVMVTHNPDLAEEYASRIVRLRDGKIIDDSMPFSDHEADILLAGTGAAAAAGALSEGMETAEEEKGGRTASKNGKKRSSMSFLTSLALSFSNLRTKKGRTILTSFAGSIGIIGIALILSLSTGVNEYIAKIQKDTMASYPISINATSMDLSSFMQGHIGEEDVEEIPAGKVAANYWDIETSSSITTGIKENNLTEFKKYLDDQDSEIQKYIGENGVLYSYNVDYKVYTYDKNNKLVDTDVDVTNVYDDENNVLGNLLEARSLMMNNMSTMFGNSYSKNGSNFTEIMPGANGDTVSAVIKDNYDVVYGNWPDSYDEVVIVLNPNGTVYSNSLYQLGYMTQAEFKDAVRMVENDQEPERLLLDYQEICDKEFYLLTASDRYAKNDSGTFSAVGTDEEALTKALDNAVKLRVVGIVKASEDASIDSLDTMVAYTSKLTDYMIEHGNQSEVILAQQADPDTDVITGRKFVSEEPDDNTKAKEARNYINGRSRKDKAELFSTVMLLDNDGGMEALMTLKMSELSEQMGSALASTIGPAVQSAVQTAMTQAVVQMQDGVRAAMEQTMQQVTEAAMKQVSETLMKQVSEEIMPQVMEMVTEAFIKDVIPQIVKSAVVDNAKILFAQIEEQMTDEQKTLFEGLKDVQSLEELIEKLKSEEFQNMDFSNIDLSKLDFEKLDFSALDLENLDLSKLDLSSIDFSKIDLSGLDLSKIDFGKVDLSNLDFSGLDLSGIDLSGLNLSNLDLSGLESAMSGLSLSMGESDMAEIVQYWLDNIAKSKTLINFYDQFIGAADYDSNMDKFGYVSYDAPSSISIYADTFEGKDGITASIKAYNDNATEENRIVYTDYVALLTTSITTIIDAISYVLIGFVAVSLFVSCIMIGVITNISVLERTKEIGVLRALGASKRNISNVFNAETFIIGGLSGILGVGVSLLLTIPINAVVHSLMDSAVLSAKLPPLSAAILILISIVITIIGGLIPANKAAKNDPVVALRTE